MDLHQLYIFTKVVENKSFSKAAEEVFLSQSTVSSHINALEKQLNSKLFDRVGRESILTPYGEKLYFWAQQLLLLKDQAMLDLKTSMNELQGNIRVAASSVPSQFIVPKMIQQFQNEYPGATFHIHESSSKKVAETVLSGKVDLAVIGDKYESEKLNYIPVQKDHLVVITAKDIDIPTPVMIQDLLKYPFIMRHASSGTNAFLERVIKKKRIPKDQLNVVAYTDSSLNLTELVRQGMGIAIVSEIVANAYEQHDLINKYEIADFNEERYFYLVYNKNKTLSLLAKLFINQFQQI